MSDNSISNNAGDVKIIRTREDINALSNLNEKAKSFLNCVFDKLDVTKVDGKLQKDEGAIYVFDDGAISVMKDGKLYAGMSAEGAEVQTIGDVLEIKFSDGAESVMKDDKLVSGKTSTNRAFKKIGDQIVFEETEETKKAKKAPKAKTEVEKADDVSPKSVSTGSINGVKKEDIDNMVQEYNKISESIDGRGGDDFDKWVKEKAKFNKKYQRMFRQLLGDSGAYKEGEISTDVYQLNFSSVMNSKTFKYYWELYNVEKIKE